MEKQRILWMNSYLGFNREEQEMLNKMDFRAFDTRRLDREILEQVSRDVRERFQQQEGQVHVGHSAPRSLMLAMGTLAFPLVVCLTPFHTLTYPVSALFDHLMSKTRTEANDDMMTTESIKSDFNNHRKHDLNDDTHDEIVHHSDMTFGEHVMNYLSFMGQLYKEISRVPQSFCERVVENWKISSKEWKERENYSFLRLAVTNGMDIFTQEELNSINTLIGDAEFYDNLQKYCTRYESSSASIFHARRSTTFGHEYKWWASLALAKSALVWYCNNDHEQIKNYSDDERQREQKRRAQFALENLQKAQLLIKDLIESSQTHNENITELERMDTLLEQNIEIVKNHLERAHHHQQQQASS
ncbi:hypothetical protein C9374_014182 [Naegleria lovaniensis]|uniref:Uncharacterized protein n=1 Tax=Naegleria lovaniensis TaxID=51637 RepID=A0AA88KV55_NAELO|nr:uncharacterized protein C9374_014182 [Naegleria lovaniensis]KAG2389622.1 hypothetical protein C9374_014182 [Naegleria lovaniensis]